MRKINEYIFLKKNKDKRMNLFKYEEKINRMNVFKVEEEKNRWIFLMTGKKAFM